MCYMTCMWISYKDSTISLKSIELFYITVADIMLIDKLMVLKISTMKEPEKGLVIEFLVGPGGWINDVINNLINNFLNYINK